MTGDARNTGRLHAEHPGNDVLSALKFVGTAAIMGGQQPARQAGFGSMDRIACERLHHLRHETIRIPSKMVAQAA
jgi:hypothetical protein